MTPGAYALITLAAAIVSSPDMARRFRDFTGRDRRVAVPFLEDLAEAVLFQIPGAHHAEPRAYRTAGAALPVLAPDLVIASPPGSTTKPPEDADADRAKRLAQEAGPQGLNGPVVPPPPAKPARTGHPGALQRTASATRRPVTPAPGKGGKP